MALKNHALDCLIIEKSREEFLEYGYQKGSLHRICKNAGVTTGAVYTRYNGKDEIFRSLVEALRKEQELCLRLLAKHYDECVLALGKSEGSSIGLEIKSLFELKANKLTNFFKAIAKKAFNISSIELIFNEEIEHYKKLLARCYKKKEAISLIEVVDSFQRAGWENLFNELESC